MGVTRDVFKKIGAIEGTFHVRLGTTNDGNSKDQTEAEEIKTREKEYTEELYKKGLNGWDNHDGVTHIEPDILECEVKWALENVTTNTAIGGDGIPAELFKILKGDSV